MGNGSSEEKDGRETFEDLLDDVEKFDQPKRGNIRPAVILQVSPNEIIVDMGVKRDGVVPKDDLDRLSPDYLASLNVGDEVPVYVLNPSDRDGNLLVSINLGLQGQDWLRAHELLEKGELVEAEVIGHNRGGLLVRFGRLEGFVPASHAMGLDPGMQEPDRTEAMDNLIGTTIGLKVIEVNQGRRRLILSQREAQREWRSQQKQRLLDELSVGDVISGVVTGIRDFGVFVDLGGADGLIHVSELAWHRVPHPRDVVSVRDEVQVYVLELDQERQRIALSLRRVKDDPWKTVGERYQIGQTIEGEVSNVVDFGAFVVLEDGIEGLLHVSEMADGTLTEPHSYVKRGDRVTVRVARIEAERRRIGFTQQGLELQGPTDVPGEQDVEEAPPAGTSFEAEVEVPAASEAESEEAPAEEAEEDTTPEEAQVEADAGEAEESAEAPAEETEEDAPPEEPQAEADEAEEPVEADDSEESDETEQQAEDAPPEEP